MSLLSIIGKLALPLTKAGGVVAIIQLWRDLDKDGELTAGILKQLDNLRHAAVLEDPSAKIRKSLSGIDSYLSEQPEIPAELSVELRRRVHDLVLRLDLADSLGGSTRKTIIKDVKAELTSLLEEALTFGVEQAGVAVPQPVNPKKKYGKLGLPQFKKNSDAPISDEAN